MKTKDIVTVAFAVILMAGSGYLIYRMMTPSKVSTENTSVTQIQEDTFTGNIDEETLKLISEKKDYGEATLDNIGRTNPFGPLN
jgi:hypothetical protein